MSDKPSFFAELKRRNVYKVAVAYAVVGVAVHSSGNDVFSDLRNSGLGDEGLVIALVVARFSDRADSGLGI